MLGPVWQKIVITLLLIILQPKGLAQPVKQIQEIREPEAATGIEQKQGVKTKEFMVVAANPYASQAGYNILQQGGSAVDAAIAVQMVLTLVEPQSSGIGGGAFILHWNRSEHQLTTFDGRETAPKKADSRLFLDENGQTIPWIKAVVGGRSVGVPGVLSALKMAHQKYGKLAWETLFQDAIKLAEQGFIVSPRLAKLVSLRFNPGITELPAIRDYFFPNGQAVKAGDTLKNPQLANVLKSIAKQGTAPFYQGWIAKKIVNAVQSSPVAPGKLSLNDMASYAAVERPAVCGPYRHYQVCGMGPPSSGGIAVLQILKQLAPFKMFERKFDDAQTLHLFTQSSRLAFADRARYLADNDFVSVPVAGLLDDNYLKQRASLIDVNHDVQPALAGHPKGAVALADDSAMELPSTSHLSIVDAQGNGVSMTSSIEMGFGSAVMVEGFILNNQLTDFSLAPQVNGKWVANRLEPLKRPRSSMAPMMVFQDGKLDILLGSPGGSRIINYVAQTLFALLDWQLTPQQAINLPKITNRNKVTTLEKGTLLEQYKPALEAKGHQVKIRDLNSGLHAIKITQDGLLGGADPRREGKVMGN
ncbi:gamma-glutamyltransferase [Thalassotalea sp. G2M2-11]|uniref:gamma-glutamyltransferase n=1 Tax=Thalassotalea sp. G2M2-11 TaxID=2787627 RepID=UPI0019D1E0BC|nr:gamma-glutamyltransferase [Thalassotalea sp. G2M2-11]